MRCEPDLQNKHHLENLLNDTNSLGLFLIHVRKGFKALINT